MIYEIKQVQRNFDINAINRELEKGNLDLTVHHLDDGRFNLEFEIDTDGFIADENVAIALANSIFPTDLFIAHLIKHQSAYDAYMKKLNEIQQEELAFMIFTQQMPALHVRVEIPKENVEAALLKAIYTLANSGAALSLDFDDLRRILINTFNLNISTSDAEKFLVRAVTKVMSSELTRIDDPAKAVVLTQYLLDHDALPAQLLEIIPQVVQLSLYHEKADLGAIARNQLTEFLKNELFQAYQNAEGASKAAIIESVANVVSKHLYENGDPRAIVIADFMGDDILHLAARKKLDYFLAHSRERTKEIAALFFYLGNDRFVDSVINALVERPKSLGGFNRNLEFRHDGIWLGTVYTEAGLARAYISDLLEKLVKEYVVGQKYSQSNVDNFYDAFISTAAALSEGKEPFFKKSDAEMLPLNQLPKLLKHGAMDQNDVVDIVIERTNIPEGKRQAYKVVLIDLIEARAAELSDFVFELKGQELI